jgi:hypothetical protein
MLFDALFAKIVAARSPCLGHAAKRGMFFDFRPVTTSELSRGGLTAKMWRISDFGGMSPSRSSPFQNQCGQSAEVLRVL